MVDGKLPQPGRETLLGEKEDEEGGMKARGEASKEGRRWAAEEEAEGAHEVEMQLPGGEAAEGERGPGEGRTGGAPGEALLTR